jgi:hypothetical protein
VRVGYACRPLLTRLARHLLLGEHRRRRRGGGGDSGDGRSVSYLISKVSDTEMVTTLLADRRLESTGRRVHNPKLTELVL